MVDFLGTIATGFSNMGRVISDYVNQTQPASGYQFEGSREISNLPAVQPAAHIVDSGSGTEKFVTSLSDVPAGATVDSYFAPGDESGGINPNIVSLDTSAPTQQQYAESYVPETRIETLAGFKTGDRGDTKTKLLEREYGLAPIQALARQQAEAIKEHGEDSKEAGYYKNELDLAKQDIRTGASFESYEKAKSGIAQAPNTQEYAADLAVASL